MPFKTKLNTLVNAKGLPDSTSPKVITITVVTEGGHDWPKTFLGRVYPRKHAPALFVFCLFLGIYTYASERLCWLCDNRMNSPLLAQYSWSIWLKSTCANYKKAPTVCKILVRYFIHYARIQHDDVTTWNSFLHHWSFVMGIRWWPMEGFPSQRTSKKTFDIFFAVSMNERFNKQWRCRWFEHTDQGWGLLKLSSLISP